MQVTDQRKLHETFSNFFNRQDWLCFCNNVACLFEAIGITCNPSEWRLFIDSSFRSLKAVLLHNENYYPSLRMAHSVHLNEDYISVKTLLSALKYDEYGWEVIGDFAIPYGPSRRFHEISLFHLPQGQYNENMMEDYIWGLLGESDLQYTRKSRKPNYI